MEKQHNRGQDGAGIGSMKLDVEAGEAFMFRERSTSSKALAKIFDQQNKTLHKLIKKGVAYPEFPETIKKHFEYGGELLLRSFGATIRHIRFLRIYHLPSLLQEEQLAFEESHGCREL